MMSQNQTTHFCAGSIGGSCAAGGSVRMHDRQTTGMTEAEFRDLVAKHWPGRVIEKVEYLPPYAGAPGVWRGVLDYGQDVYEWDRALADLPTTRP